MTQIHTVGGAYSLARMESVRASPWPTRSLRRDAPALTDSVRQNDAALGPGADCQEPRGGRRLPPAHSQRSNHEVYLFT
jgi:hypothetical protein